MITLIIIIAILVILTIVLPDRKQNYLEKIDDKTQEEALREYMAKKEAKKRKGKKL